MIKIDNISKTYRVYPRRADRLREWLWFGRKKLHKEFKALQNISLEVPTGSVFGIIGMNGAGKSTLLKILTGTTTASSGKVEIKGRVAAMLELGTGFHPELSGRDNVIVNGKLLGLSQDEIAERLPDIEAFCELGEFFDKPVRTYSSGMYVRLAFALSVSVRPDVFIIDEALSVGDAYFQQKCLRQIQELKRRGVTILFVSHDLVAVKILCDQVALLNHGQIVMRGDVQDVLEGYNALLAKHEGTGHEYVIEKGPADAFGRPQMRSGNNKAQITKVELLDRKNSKVQAVTAGDHCQVCVDVEFSEAMTNPTVGILIRDRVGYDVFGTNTAEMHYDTGTIAAGTRMRFVFDCKMNMGPGNYTVSAAAHTSTTHVEECYQWADRILTFEVLPRSDYRFIGVSLLDPQVRMQPAAATAKV